MSFAVASVVVPVVTAVAGSNAASNAASAQARAAREAAEMQQRQYDQTRADQAPWREAGGRALTQMEDPSFQKSFTMADYQADPGYAFRMAEGQKALERSAAARGNRLSGGTLKALTQYGQGVASEEYGKAYDRFNNDQTTRFNRLASVAGVGQTAVGQTSTAGQNYVNNASNALMEGANANAAGTIGQANAIAGGINTGVSNWMTLSQMNKQTASPVAPAASPVSSYSNFKQNLSAGDW